LKKLSDYTFLNDENVDPQLISFLREIGLDVFDVKENKLFGSSDETLLELAFKNNKVIITLDSDFGTLAYKKKKDFIGIIFLKPGHFTSSYHIDSLKAVLFANPSVENPFIITAEWSKTGIKIRLRNSIKIL
jgi:predicted nuclease of predicted toxin-antitoxin system